MSTLFGLLQQREIPYNRKNVLKLLCKIKYAKSEEMRVRYNEQLYFELGRIVLKNINGFFSYVRSKGVSDEKILHTQEDIAVESYIVLVNCTKNINLKYKDSFHFFYNTSLLRRNKRIFERQYRKHLGVLKNSDKVEFVLKNTNAKSDHINFEDIDLSSFSPLEISLLKSKLNKERVGDFKKRFEINSDNYKILLTGVEEKIKKLYYDTEHV